jgi:AraC-like DNA-binding protein
VTTVITTDGLRPSEKEALWRHAMSETFVSVTIGDLAEGDFAGLISADWIGRLMIAEVVASGQDIHRTTSHINHADAEYFQVALMNSGVGRISQDGRQAELHPGDCVVYETNRPFQWLFDGDWDTWVFTFPRESVRLSESERRLLTARRLAGRAGITGVVSRFLLDLARNSEHLAAQQSEQVLAHASDLVVTLLSDSVEESEAVRGCLQRSLMLRVKDYVAQRLSDPALGPLEIATAVNISTRYLHKLFEAEHCTVSQYVKGLRLERCRRDLLDPRLADRSISAVAFGCGFGDLSGFNRAFKNAYGISPRELRTAPVARDAV